MSEKRDLMKLFHEDNLVDGMPVAPDLQEHEQREFDLFSLIWEESADASRQLNIDADRAWEKLTPAEPKVVPITTQEGKPPVEQKSAKVVPFRRYVMAGAAVLLILIVGSRVLMQNNDVAEYKTFASVEEARSFAYNSMMPIAETILAQAQNEDFENKVYSMAGERFDGESNVLLELLADDMPLRKRFADKLAAFRNIDGNNYFPQVYIPDYEDYYQKDGSPVVVIYVSDQPTRDGNYAYMGYKYENGSLVEYAMIDENVLQQERVWVMSINENVDNFGELPQADFGGQMVSNGAGSRIDRIAVYEAKESWAGGASELRIRGVMESWNGLDPSGQVGGRPTLVSTSKPTGVRIKSLRREDLGNEVEIDYPLHVTNGDEDFLADEVQLAFVLFEADVWPNTVNQAVYRLANGESRMFTYCSAQEHYDVSTAFTSRPPDGWKSPLYPSGIPDTHYINSFSRSNEFIRYNTEMY